MKAYHEGNVRCPDCHVEPKTPGKVFIVRSENARRGYTEPRHAIHIVDNSEIREHEYYDDFGIYHHHNPNQYEMTFKCEQGHYFKRKFGHPCPNCTFGHEKILYKRY